MSTELDRRWEAQVKRAAAAAPFPPTPEISRAVARALGEPTPSARRPALRLSGAAAVLLLVAGITLLLSPSVRAALAEFLQIGAVRIERAAPTSAPARQETPAVAPTATPVALDSPLNLIGETSLENARSRLDVPIRLPGHPPDLGKPDRVFVQRVGGTGQFALLVWTEPDRPEAPALSLMVLEPDAFVSKTSPPGLVETTVNGEPAVWTDGPYMLIHRVNRTDFQRLIEGHVLIWVEEIDGVDVTHRLETDLPLEEAIRIAESLE